MSTEESTFIQGALNRLEKAQKFQRMRQIVVTVRAFAAAFWLAAQSPSRELNMECVLITGFALIAGVCTAKIMALINKNTLAVLQAIATLEKR